MMKRALLASLAALLSIGSAHAQTVSPSFFGMHLSSPTKVSVPFYMAITRTWDALDGSNTSTHWPSVEIAPGVYSWTATDAVVTALAATNAKIVYTFGYTPDWANSAAGKQVPPTNPQDFYDFVTSVVTRYAGRIQYYECWNEPHQPAWWSGTVSQLVTFCQNVYSIVHAIDPAALVLTPSGDPPYLTSYLAAGGGAYADIANSHGYRIVPAPNKNPEQVFNLAVELKSVFSGYGYGSMPLFIDEYGWGANADNITTTAGQTQYAAVLPALLASGGVARALWYQFDPGTWGTLYSSTTRQLNQPGHAYVEMEKWLIGATFTSPITRQAATNGIRNPTGTGMVAGTPGTPPTNWSVVNPDSSNGISTQWIGSGTENGVPYVDFRVFGTLGSGTTSRVQVLFEANNQIAATGSGQWWEIGLNLKSTSCTGATFQFQGQAYSSAPALIDTPLIYSVPMALPGSLDTDLQQWGAVTDNASTAFMRPLLRIGYTVSVPIDCTVRIGNPTLDTGSVWKGTITRPFAPTQADIVWDASGGPTTYSTSYSYYRDNTGTVYSVSGGQVTLTQYPIVLENSAWKGLVP